MPIALECPGCGTKLAAPDSAAGKRVKCRKCHAVLTVPVPEPEPDLVIDDEPPEAELIALTAPPKRRPAAVEDEEADEDEEEQDEEDEEADEEDEERPRKSKARKGSKRKRRKAGPNPALLAGIGVAAVVLIGGAGYAVWHFALRDGVAVATTPTTEKKDPVAAMLEGWEAYEQPEYRVMLPKDGSPVTSKRPGAGRDAQIPGKSAFKTADIDGKKLLFSMITLAVPENEMAELRGNPDKVRNEMLKGARLYDRKNISPDGHIGVEFHAHNEELRMNMVGRIILKGSVIVMVIAMETDLLPTDPVAKAFLAGFKLK